MVAGAVAGMGEHLAMYPVDTIKTQMQALAAPGQQVHWGQRPKLLGGSSQMPLWLVHQIRDLSRSVHGSRGTQGLTSPPNSMPLGG